MSRRGPLLLSLAGLAAVLVGLLVFGNLNGSLVYYLTPAEALARQVEFDEGRRFRLAGQVAPGSVVEEDAVVTFTVGDPPAAVAVRHRGAPPQLFREGIEVVVEGAWSGATFMSDTMIVKHDENYAPPADADAEVQP